MRTPRTTGQAILAFAVVLASCTDSTAPRDAHVAPLAAEILDAVHGSGNGHFYLLPPLVKATTYLGTFDATLSPTVNVCEWTSHGCGAVVATFSMASGTGGTTIQRSTQDQSYSVVWHTDQCITGCPLDPAKTYRIRVSVLDTELGHADVDVVASGSELRNVQTNDYIPLLEGRSLPIRFRIEQGALFVATPSTTTQTFTTAPASDGSTVALSVPPGALAAPTALTVSPAPATATPSDARLAGETVYAFGPDGSTFAAPLIVTIAYDPRTLPSGTDQSKLRLFWTERAADGSISWRPVAGSRVDVVAHTVSGAVSHFSYGTIGSVACDGPTPAPQAPLMLTYYRANPVVAVYCDDAGNVVPSFAQWSTANDGVAYAEYDGSSWSLVATAVGITTVNAAIIAQATPDTIFTSTTAIVEAPAGTSALMPHELWLTIGDDPTWVSATFGSPSDSIVVASNAVRWSMRDTSVAIMASDDAGGTSPEHSALVLAVAEGTTMLDLVIPGFADSVVIHSTPVASVQAVNPDGAVAQWDSLFFAGDAQQLRAVAYDRAGNELPPRQARWTSSDPSIATVSADGLVTAVGHGQVRITAWIDDRTCDVWINVQ